MFVRKLPYIIYRAYPNRGYLTDNRNFGYDTASQSCLKVGDMLLSKEGGVFYSLLDNYYRSVDEIARDLMGIYRGADYEMLLEDAIVFYRELSDKGFVSVSADRNDSAHKLDYFSYENKKPFVLDIGEEQQVNFQEIFKGGFSLSRVHLDVSSRCNEDCVHCYIPKKNKCSVMTPEMFDEVLAQCVMMNVLNITLSGGEPMLNPCLKSFILKCIEANFSVNILSNLTCLTDDLLETIASNPLICIQTSLYAMDANVHDSITRREGSFRKTLDAITKLHDHNVPIQINCPIMRQNLPHYHNVLDFAASLNIEASSDYVLFGCYDSSGSNHSCRISTAQVGELLKVDYDDGAMYEEAVRVIESKKIRDDDPICSVCKSSLCVANNGDVYPCEGWQRMILGNIRTDTLKYIWEESSLTQHLRSLVYRTIRGCDSCDNRKYCTTCLIMNANDNDNEYMKVNPYMCELAAVKKSAIIDKNGGIR